MKNQLKRIMLAWIVLVTLVLCSKLMAAAAAAASSSEGKVTYRSKTVADMPLKSGCVAVIPYAVSEEGAIRVIMGTTKIPEGDTGPFSKPSISMITGELAFDGASHTINKAANFHFNKQTDGIMLVSRDGHYAFVNEGLGLDIAATRQEVVKIEFPSGLEYWLYFLDMSNKSAEGISPFELLETLSSAMNRCLSNPVRSAFFSERSERPSYFSAFSVLPLDFVRGMMVRESNLGNSLAFRRVPESAYGSQIHRISYLQEAILKLEEEINSNTALKFKQIYTAGPHYGRRGGLSGYDITLSSAGVVEATKSFLGKLTSVSPEMNTQLTFLRTLESDVRTRLAALRENPVALAAAPGEEVRPPVSSDPDPSAGAAAAAAASSAAGGEAPASSSDLDMPE